MTQYARPASDISSGLWTDEGPSFNDGNLYTSVQEVTQDGDTSYINCPGPSGGTAEVKLGSVTDPVGNVNHIVHIYGEGVGSGSPERIDVYLYEATTLIATIMENWGPGRSGYVDIDYTLSAGEADSIGDYADLRVRMVDSGIGSGEHFKITQIYLEVPDVAAATTYDQKYFRFRIGDTVGINTDSGWLATENTNVSLGTGVHCRVRIKVGMATTDNPTNGFRMQASRNAGVWVNVDMWGSGAADTGPISGLESEQFSDGAAITSALLTTEEAWLNGEGVAPIMSVEPVTALTYSLTEEESEFEWCFFIQSLHDGPAQNVASDSIRLRLVENDGTVFTGAYVYPTITVVESPGYIGGTFAETPMRVGPIKNSDGNLYYLCEYAETENDYAMMKSTDGGDTWRVMDDAGRPSANDIETADLVLVGDTIHMICADGSSIYLYHQFHTSSHGSTPDEWDGTVIDESVDSGITINEQSCAISMLSGGDVYAIYNKSNGSNNSVFYNKRTSGSWGTPTEIDTQSTDFSGITAVQGESYLTHIFYYDITNTTIWHKSLSSGGSLSGRESIITDGGAVPRFSSPWFPPIYWDNAGAETILLCYIDTDKYTFEKRIIDDASPGSETAVSDTVVAIDDIGSRMPDGDIVVYDGDLYTLFARDSDNAIYKDENTGSGWGTDAAENTDATMHALRAQVFTHSSGNGGDTVIGYIFDGLPYGSDGGTGMVWYDEIVLDAGGGNFQDVEGVLTATGILSKEISKTPTGSVTGSGTLVRSSIKAFTGSVTTSGVLATSKATLLAIGGAITAAGTLIKQTSKPMAGSITAVGTLVKRTAKIFVGSLTLTGTLVKQTAKSFIGSITIVGSLATQKISGGYFQVVGGVLTMSGVVIKQTSKSFVGSVTAVGVLIKRVAKASTGSLTPSGVLSTTKVTLLSIGGSIIASGTVIKQTATTLIGSITTVGSLIAQKAGVGGEEFYKAVGGAVAMAGILTRQTGKQIIGIITMAGAVFRHLIGLPTPARQIFAIAAESRIFPISSENRIYSVPRGVRP